jgi:SOS-response transcriptional repressor LexA
MLPGTYEARSLDTSATATVPLYGRASGRLIRERIVVFIATYWAERGWAPTLREVAVAVGLRQANVVAEHVEILAAAGRVAHEPHTPRSLRVVER